MAQDTSTLTACINDYGSDDIFKRVFSALSSDGDVLLAITTSGNSKNIIETLKLANERGIYSLGFLGEMEVRHLNIAILHLLSQIR